jgi:hypothetical protein
MKTILVADPRPDVQAFLELVLADQGYAVRGQADLVLTPDGATARFWSKKRVPVVAYHFADALDLDDLLATTGALLDPPRSHRAADGLLGDPDG